MDSGLSTRPGLEGLRADVPQRAVTMLAVVVGFDVFKHGFTHLSLRVDALVVDALDLQSVEDQFPLAFTRRCDCVPGRVRHRAADHDPGGVQVPGQGRRVL